MKRLLPIFLVFFVAASLSAEAHLSDYPSGFVHGGRFTGQIIVGVDAPVTDVLAATEIATVLQRSADVPVSAFTDGEFVHQGGILIGLPCLNSALAEVLKTDVCGLKLKDGEGLLKMIDYGGYSYLVVSGASAADTRKAARFLASNSMASYPVEEMRIGGTLESPVAILNAEPLVIEDPVEAECDSDADCRFDESCIAIKCLPLGCPEGTVAVSHDCIASTAPESGELENASLKIPEITETESSPAGPVAESVSGQDEKLLQDMGFFARIVSFFVNLFG